jgi:ribosomal protein S27AE
MEGKWKCRRCGENKASSVVFDDGDCLNYCPDCLGDDEDRFVCGVCGKTEPKDVEWDVGAMEDFRGDVICPDCLGDDEEKDELCSAIDASGNALW